MPGIPQDTRVFLFTANSIRRNIWKDYKTMRAAVVQVAGRLHDQTIHFFALNEDALPERIDQAKVCFVSYQKDCEPMARYYQAGRRCLCARRSRRHLSQHHAGSPGL